MANWNGLVMTDKGIALQSKVQAGEVLNITKLKLGSGTLPEETDIRKLTDLIKPEQNLGIGGREPNGDYCKISATISNVGLEAGYYVRELGVFAQDPDDGEILYAYTTDGAPDYLPAEGGSTVISQEFSVNIAVSDTDKINVEIDPGALATMGYVQLQVNEHNEDASAHEKAFSQHNTDETAHYDMTGATGSKAGKRGLVPAPKAGDQNKALFGNGTYKQVVETINGVKPDQNNNVTLITGINMLTRTKQYKIGDIAYSPNLPSWAYLSCVAAGTTAAEEPSFTSVTVMGKYITDGSVKWIVEDIRFNVPVGVVFYDSYLHDGCVKFNGATVNRTDYVRLEKLANDKNLWTDDPSTEPYKYGRGDGSTTMVLPDLRNVFIEGGDTPAKVEAGAPNIKGNSESSIYAKANKTGSQASVTSAIYGNSTFNGITLMNDNSNGYGTSNILIDASRCNSIYGNSETIQPPAIILIPQVRY